MSSNTRSFTVGLTLVEPFCCCGSGAVCSRKCGVGDSTLHLFGSGLGRSHACVAIARLLLDQIVFLAVMVFFASWRYRVLGLTDRSVSRAGLSPKPKLMHSDQRLVALERVYYINHTYLSSSCTQCCWCSNGCTSMYAQNFGDIRSHAAGWVDCRCRMSCSIWKIESSGSL